MIRSSESIAHNIAEGRTSMFEREYTPETLNGAPFLISAVFLLSRSSSGPLFLQAVLLQAAVDDFIHQHSCTDARRFSTPRD
jgi:hypothetical protein